jgi:cation:H+ antiporter
MIDSAAIAVGLIILFAGGEATLRGSVSLAKTLGVSAAMIGLVVVGFGTSAPELVVTLRASLGGQPDIGVGNVVGSNIANILLVIGIGAIVYPLTCEARAIRRTGTMMLGVSILLVALALNGRVGAIEGGFMVAALICFLAWSYVRDRRHQTASAKLHSREADEPGDLPLSVFRITIYLVFGLAALIGGAALLVEGATGIARSFGVPESVIGLSLIAIGTSLPEVAATVVAAIRRHTDVAIAGILGSNIFNVLGILGVAALVKPLPVANDIASIDIWVMLAASLVILPILFSGLRVSRQEGVVLLVLYVSYISSMALRLPG